MQHSIHKLATGPSDVQRLVSALGKLLDVDAAKRHVQANWRKVVTKRLVMLMG